MLCHNALVTNQKNVQFVTILRNIVPVNRVTLVNQAILANRKSRIHVILANRKSRIHVIHVIHAAIATDVSGHEDLLVQKDVEDLWDIQVILDLADPQEVQVLLEIMEVLDLQDQQDLLGV